MEGASLEISAGAAGLEWAGFSCGGAGDCSLRGEDCRGAGEGIGGGTSSSWGGAPPIGPCCWAITGTQRKKIESVAKARFRAWRFAQDEEIGASAFIQTFA